MQPKVKFYKYQGTGNDFIMIDNREVSFPKNDTALINKLCDRRFGIGADGLILLENDDQVDFKMVYYNSDGKESSMCGNGGRCIVAFAKQLSIIDQNTTFTAVDGLHHATILDDNNVALQMKDVDEVLIHDAYVFLNTGSPHHVTLVNDLQEMDVKQNGKAIRYSELYGEAGSNVNFVSQISENHFAIRTYERGVEDETLSCGTGATAVAIAMHSIYKTKENKISIDVQGGQLVVSFELNETVYEKVFLEGPAEFVFEGQVNF
ncbi:MAG: diaminopimelate epimerase [Flavobacterium sp.]|nr:diaminopimelate epimerase [Flavobacterium sp.]